jgi:hypothetical protein
LAKKDRRYQKFDVKIMHEKIKWNSDLPEIIVRLNKNHSAPKENAL